MAHELPEVRDIAECQDHPRRARGNGTALNEHVSTAGEIVGPAHREARRDNLADERRIEAGLGKQVLDGATDDQIAIASDQLAGRTIGPENDATCREQTRPSDATSTIASSISTPWSGPFGDVIRVCPEEGTPRATRVAEVEGRDGEDSYRGGLGETAGLTEIFWMTPEVTEIAAPFGGTAHIRKR